MALIPQQDVIAIHGLGRLPQSTVDELKKRLNAYPPCRIVSIAFMASVGAPGTDLIAVIETI